MGLGFNSNNAGHDIQHRYQQIQHPPQVSSSPDIWKILKGIGGIIATLVLLGGLVWGSAVMFAGMASDEDVDKLEDRVELVEKNDIKQTLILEQIKDTLSKIDEKLNKALGQ